MGVGVGPTAQFAISQTTVVQVAMTSRDAAQPLLGSNTHSADLDRPPSPCPRVHSVPMAPKLPASPAVWPHCSLGLSA